MIKLPPSALLGDAMAESGLHDLSVAYSDSSIDPVAFTAAFHLYHMQPVASAGHSLAPPLALILGPSSFVLGLIWLVPGVVLSVLIGLLYLYIFALIILRIGAGMVGCQHAPPPALATRDLPEMSVIVAMYRESEVVAGLCAGLNRLDYPRDRLDILLVLEAGDRETISAARAAARRYGFRVLIAPACGPQTKPRALNYALQFARGSLVTVYDAEDSPSCSQLRQAAAAFAANDRLGVVQAPLGWYNGEDCWLTRQFALEYAAQFHGILPLLSRLSMPLPLGGTSNVFRVDALEACGGWDPFNVTEDADLGFRLARHGWQAGLIPAGTGEEAPTTLAPWIGQRSRWLKGHLVTWLVQMRQPRQLVASTGWRGLCALQLTLLANVFSAIAQLPGLILISTGVVLAAVGAASWLTFLGLGFGLLAWAASLICLWSSARRAGVRCRVTDLLSTPLYWLCQLPAAMRALKEMGSEPYVWVKTRHGVSTTRREAPDDTHGHSYPDGDYGRAVCPVRLAVEPAH